MSHSNKLDITLLPADTDEYDHEPEDCVASIEAAVSAVSQTAFSTIRVFSWASVRSSSHSASRTIVMCLRICLVNGVVLRGSSVVVPTTLCHAVLEVLGSAHQGVVSMGLRAWEVVYWPGTSNDMKLFKKSWPTCIEVAPSQSLGHLFPPQLPLVHFESLVADYFDLGGHHYLVIDDRLSSWTEVVKVSVRSHLSGAHGLCSALREVFARFRVPRELSSDAQWLEMT